MAAEIDSEFGVTIDLASLTFMIMESLQYVPSGSRFVPIHTMVSNLGDSAVVTSNLVSRELYNDLSILSRVVADHMSLLA